jgi:hypothetical protein
LSLLVIGMARGVGKFRQMEYGRYKVVRHLVVGMPQMGEFAATVSFEERLRFDDLAFPDA